MKVRVSDHPMDGPEAGSSPKKDLAAEKRMSRRNSIERMIYRENTFLTEDIEEWTVRQENLDGTICLDSPSFNPRDREDVDVRLLCPLRVMQVRMPASTVLKITEQASHEAFSKLQSKSRFYLLTASDGHIKLLDQMCLVCALRTVAPTMNIACCYAISLNILVRYGVNADVNGDGEISPDEWAALDVILRAQGAGAAVDPQHTKHAKTKHRLISLML
mmetsp:Transcript_11770/g.31758  ORF Transcript_11770/g.31758 Transcript_11770/m.31758 type:complete len:218 (+) Transcript_11770:320-973(+)